MGLDKGERSIKVIRYRARQAQESARDGGYRDAESGASLQRPAVMIETTSVW
jgi:hypothetical protein